MENQTSFMKTIAVEHVTIQSSNSFAVVKAKLERLIPRIDDGIFTLLRYGETIRALKELEALPALSIFGVRDHGALLGIAGLQRHAIQYDIGNPLTASKCRGIISPPRCTPPFACFYAKTQMEWSPSSTTVRSPFLANSVITRSTRLRVNLMRTCKRHW